MGMFKAGVYSVVATGAKLLTALAIVKIVAIYAGPEGVGRLGQFLSLMSLVTIFAGGGISSGVVKYVAEYRNQPEERCVFLRTAVGYTLVASLIVAVILAAASGLLSQWLLGSSSYRSIILTLAAVQVLIAIHNFFLSVINGYMDVSRVTAINVLGAATSLSIAAILAYLFRLQGALYAVVLGQGALLFVSYPILKHSPWFDRKDFYPSFDKKTCRLLANFSLMTLASALLSPLVQIWVRNHLALHFSWEEVGYWQAVAKVSDAYLLCITTALSVYYLPKLSGIRTKIELLIELKTAYAVLVPAVLIGAAAVYFFRHLIILVLYSEDFAASAFLFAPQLVGDVLKVASFVLSYLMVAKAMTRLFIFSEIVFSSMYIGWVTLLTAKFGLIGVMYAFIANYSIYLLFNVVIVKRYINRLP